jgi:hypothetical protein
MEAVVEPVTLFASELVSNAVRHGKPPIQLLLRRVGRGCAWTSTMRHPGLDLRMTSTGLPGCLARTRKAAAASSWLTHSAPVMV